MIAWKKLFRTISKGAAIAALALLSAFLLAFAFAQTDWGKNALAKAASSALSKDEARVVEVGRLSGWIPFNFQIREISISDERGPWLALEGLRVRWSPFALLGGRLSIHELTARHLEVLRMPQGKEKAPSQTPRLSQLPGALSRLQVERLAVERVELGEDLGGEPVVLTLKATVGEANAQGAIQTLLRIERLDRPGASLKLNMLYRIREAQLSVDLRFEELQGGLVARLMGLEGPLAFSFSGHGPALNLEGALSAHAGGIGLLESEVFLKMEKHVQVLAQGTVRLNPAVSPYPIPGIEEALPFSLSVRVPETGLLILDRFALQAGDAALDLEASFDPREQLLEGRYKLLLGDLEILQPLLEEHLKGSMTAEGRFSGPLLRPRIALHIELTDASGFGARASRMEAAFQLDLLQDLDSFPPSGKITGSGVMEDFVLEGVDALSRKLITWELALRSPEKDGIQVSRFLLKSGGESLQVSGIIDPSGPKGVLDIALESEAPSALFEAAGVALPWVGPTRLDAAVEGNVRPLSLKTRFEAASTLVEEHLPGIILLPLAEVAYGGTLFFAQDPDEAAVLTVPRLWLETAGAAVEGQGSFDFGREALSFSWESLFPEPASFISIPNFSPKGSLQWTGALEGPLSSIEIATDVEAHSLEVEGVLLERAVAGLKGVYTPTRQEGIFFLDLFQEEKWIKAGSDFSLEGSLLHLSEISVTGFESALTGKATLDLETGDAQGEIRGRVSDLSLLFALAGQDLHGSAEGEAAFRLGPEARSLALSVDASDLSSPLGSAQGLQLKSRVEGTGEHMKGSLDLHVREARIAEGSVARFAFKVHGDADRAAFQLEGEGRYGEDFEAKASGIFTLSKEAQKLALDNFQAQYGPVPIALARPTAVIKEKGALHVEETFVTLDTGSLKGSGTYTSSHARIDLDFEELPMELLKAAGVPGLSGKASGALALEGSPEEPEAIFALQAADLRFEEDYFPDLPSLSLDLKGTFGGERVKADLALLGLTPDPLKGSVDFPLALSLAPFSISLDSQRRMEAALHGQVPLPHAAALLGLDDQELEGRLEASLDVAGPVASPRVTGRLRWVDGAYENFRTGTILKEATLLITAENERLVIREAEARDGEKGAIALQGWLDLSPERDFPFQMDLALRDATLIRHDALTARTRGDLVFSGNSKGALLSGEIVADLLEARIPERLPPAVADLEIIEIHEGDEAKKDRSPVPERRRAVEDPFLQIRVTVILPNRAYLSGRGLDSEWQGRLDIQGPAGEPSITGELSVVRGHFNFLGRRFNLTRGVVSFMGAAPPAPILDLTAEARTKDITAFLTISGKVDSPELVLTSQPPLPSDEILSRLLFGRSVTQVSPLQAVQLAHALDVLAGRRSFDLVDHTRRMLGLDYLEIRDLGAELDEAALRAGKYLAENVYIEVEQGLGPESGRASLQWEITPNITIQTEVGINAEAGAGIQWRWDY